MDAELALAPRPDLVRTARLVAGAAARRAGVHEDLIDELRLAVGEAAARAVVRHQRSGRDDAVVVRWRRTPDTFTVEVVDRGGPGGDGDDLAVAVIEALAPVSADGPGPDGGSVLRMGWPLAPEDR